MNLATKPCIGASRDWGSRRRNLDTRSRRTTCAGPEAKGSEKNNLASKSKSESAIYRVNFGW